MAKIEKIIVTLLTTAALAGAVFAYCAKRSKQDLEIISFKEAGHIEAAKDIIEQRIIIDINTAGKGTLVKIPGVGPYLAENIIDYRRESGRFESPSDIMKVKGIGIKKYEIMKEYIRVDE